MLKFNELQPFQFYHDARELESLISNEMKKVKRRTEGISFSGDVKEVKDMTRFMKVRSKEDSLVPWASHMQEIYVKANGFCYRKW